MSAHQKLATAFATTLALSAVSAAQISNTNQAGSASEADAVLVDAQCFLNASVEGTWHEPTAENGRLVGTMFDAQGAPQFLLDAEISRYVFQQVDGTPADEIDAGGIMGAAHPVDGSAIELMVMGEWLRRGDEAGSFGLTIFLVGDNIPLLAVGAMQGEFLPEGEPGVPPGQGPFIMHPNREDRSVPYGDDIRSPSRDSGSASGAPHQGGTIGATASGASSLGQARGLDLPGADDQKHDAVKGVKKLGKAHALDGVAVNPPAQGDDRIVDTRELGGARSLGEVLVDEPPFRMPGSGISGPRDGGTISATASGAKNLGQARNLPGADDQAHDAVVGVKKLGKAHALDGVAVNPPARVVDPRELGGARSLGEVLVGEPPFSMPGSGIGGPRDGGTISATASGAKNLGQAQGFGLPGANDSVVGARNLGGAHDLGQGTLVDAPLKSGAFLGSWELCMGG
jgi:hypothetical protein